MRIATIIVDVPNIQTDQLYTYIIPKELHDVVQVGIRVHIPFGSGNRLIQGLVLGTSYENENNKELHGIELKEIVEVLDFSPVLNEEQIYLASEIRKTVFSCQISILKAMLPTFLNSIYDKLLSATNELSEKDHLAIFGDRDVIRFSSLDKATQARTICLIKSGKIHVKYQAKVQQPTKRKNWYRVDQIVLKTLIVPPKSEKKEALKRFLETHPDGGCLTNLRKKFSYQAVKFFISQSVLVACQKENYWLSHYVCENTATVTPVVLNADQKRAVEAITSKIGRESLTFLLKGITGSGKTEVYLQVVDVALKRGKTAIVLVPDISLTSQMLNRFARRFGNKVAVIHSGLSELEKYDEWRKIKRGDAQVVIGARSAIFSPLKNLGAIIIDEEHDAHYKQDHPPRYHTRDVALLRSEYNQAVLVLGSATPSLESRARASRGIYYLLELRTRANPQSQVPKITVVDFRDYIGNQKESNFTPVLVQAISEAFLKKEQVVLLLNRRGYSNFVMCRDCGTVDTCINCDISLTLHMNVRGMRCHYCGFRKEVAKLCLSCDSPNIRPYGAGTQKAYDELTNLFPGSRILRMDIDTTRRKGSHERLLTQFGEGKADVLLGTKMIAQGLDFPNVTLVGVLNADTLFNLPDFRSSERTFQLLTQVAGRAGRSDKAGTVIIQTYNPQHYAIQFAKNQDYDMFYQHEMNIRKNLVYPPYCFTVIINISHPIEKVAVRTSHEVVNILRRHLSTETQILGPSPKPIVRTHNFYHYQILLKYRIEKGLFSVLNEILDFSKGITDHNLRLSIDNEPQNFM